MDRKQYVYVCLKETPDLGKCAVGIYDNEDSAREWIRQEYLKFKAEDPKNECACSNNNYSWGEEDYGIMTDTIGGVMTTQWYCFYQLESYGWYVVKLPVLGK